MTRQVKTGVVKLLREYKEIFAWSHEDMLGINANVTTHHLTVSKDCKPVI